MSKEERIEALEKDTEKFSARLGSVEELLKKKTSDYENEAKLSSEQATAFKSTSEEAKNTIEQHLTEANSKLEALRSAYGFFEEAHKKIKEFSDDSWKNNEAVKKVFEEVQAKHASYQSHIAEIEKIVANKPVIDEKLKALEDVFTRGSENDIKLNSLYKSITERKNEIDDLYYQIIGYTEKNDEGIETQVKGMKDELQDSYTQLKADLVNLNKEMTDLKEDTILVYKGFQNEKENAFTESMKSWEEKYASIEKKISDLLPRALTTGLSYAYSEKKQAEEKESEKLGRTFYFAIGGLILVSLIPFAVSLNSILTGVSWAEVLLRIPRLVIAILPLYVPVLWVAYSANRKMNLSKRLIEEYSHKEVLSKTFEGLSKQINDVDDKDVSSDLRIRLLYNILEVNSENPGKLISDYNKSDHPVMDALDKSVKLSNAVTKVSKIPGLNKLLVTLAKRSEETLAKENEKAEAGLASIQPEKANGNAAKNPS